MTTYATPSIAALNRRYDYGISSNSNVYVVTIQVYASILWRHPAAFWPRTERMRFLRYADT
ncbi:hypothetical protein N9X05_07960 [Paracoccaceae bacterium]|nr:hypothetical protein [Paracoccaceae bacterium]